MTIHDAFATAAAVLLALGGGGGIVLAMSSWLGKVWAERILAGERAELQKLTLEHQVRFTWYHQKKAELIANLYALLNDVTDQVRHYVSPLQPSDEPARLTHAKMTFETYNKLAAEFYRNKIFLETDICEKVEAIVSALRTAMMDFQISQDPQLKDTKLWAQAYKAMDKQVPPLLAELEQTFRQMLSKIGPAV